MKSLTTKCFCLRLQLYKIGLLIGIIYIAFNILTIWSVLMSDDDAYVILPLSLFTILTSIILIYGLVQNRHALLLPWLTFVGVLILLNIFAVIALVAEAARLETRDSFYAACECFLILEVQVFFWYTIFALFRVGHRKTFRVVEFQPENTPVKPIDNKETFKIYLVGTDVNANHVV